MVMDRNKGKDNPAPLYFQLINRMRKDILGKLAPGAPIPSERVLCEQFKMSRITVRKALEELTVNGEIYKLHGKGTFKSGNTANRTRELVYVVYNTSMVGNPGNEDSLPVLAETAEERGYHLVIRGYHSIGGNAGLRDFALRNINGGLLMSVQELTRADILSIQQARIPCVFLNQATGYAVLSDYVAAGRLAAEWINRKKFRQTALLRPSRKLPDIRDYLTGLQETLAPEYPIAVQLETGYGRQAAAEAVKQLLDSRNPPDAVLCLDDMTAVGAIEVLTERGLRGKIPVCGMNNSYLAALMKFSSIDLGRAGRARLAANLLADILEGKAPPPPHIVTIKPTFIEREFK